MTTNIVFFLLLGVLALYCPLTSGTEIMPTSTTLIKGPISALYAPNLKTKDNLYVTMNPNSSASVLFTTTQASNVFIFTFTMTFVSTLKPTVEGFNKWNNRWMVLPEKAAYPITYNGKNWVRRIWACDNSYYNTTTKSVNIRITAPNAHTTIDYARVGVVYPGGTVKFTQNTLAWNRNIANSPKASNSDTIINWLTASGGFGAGGKLRIDYSFQVLEANQFTSKKTIVRTEDFWSPDCDITQVPVPLEGRLEGEPNYSCATDGDCHLIVHDKFAKKVYEMYRGNLVGSTWFGGCSAVWKVNATTYPINLRGEFCTSADAGGFPISAMLFSADEVASGVINHAIRFILPNDRIARLKYVYPSTHSTTATTGHTTSAPPYGVLFRLKADFAMSRISNLKARVVAKALQTYGMYLSDGGNLALTGNSDTYTAIKWAELGMDSFSLNSIGSADFEVVQWEGPLHTWDGDCARNVI